MMNERAEKDFVEIKKNRFSPGGPKAIRRDVTTRWGGDPIVTRNGFVPVATTFLWHAARLGLSPVETLLIINLMSHKWSVEQPHPSYTKLAARLGISVVYCRKLMRSLHARGFIERQPAKGGTNRFDLQPLFFKLRGSIEQQDRYVEWERKNENPSAATDGSEGEAPRK